MAGRYEKQIAGNWGAEVDSEAETVAQGSEHQESPSSSSELEMVQPGAGPKGPPGEGGPKALHPAAGTALQSGSH